MRFQSVLPMMCYIKIIRDGRVIRGYFGVQSEITSNSNGGIVITGVTANSPAAKAGIQVGDVILRLNKRDNLSIREMMQIISDTKPKYRSYHHDFSLR